MQPIETLSGTVVGWFRDPHVVDDVGRDVAFVQGWGLFGYEGGLRGYFEDGLFRDKAGLIVARIGRQPATPPPTVEWTRKRRKETRERALIIHFSDESAPEGWRDVFAHPESAAR